MKSLRLAILGILCTSLLPTMASASYILSVVQDGKTVLQQEIRIMPEDSTIATWKTLLDYGMTPTKDAKGHPGERKGRSFRPDGEGEGPRRPVRRLRQEADRPPRLEFVEAEQSDGLHLYRGTFPPTIWLIEPADAARILALVFAAIVRRRRPIAEASPFGRWMTSNLMSLVCDRCRRVNPDEAYYCYFDGASLAGRATSGPINLGTQPFPSPYVFPSGISARNFDQLAMACRKSWKEAIEMLREGYLASFFGSIGRVDLARSAQESAKFPEIHRGLDELLGKLPTQVLEAPKLNVEPTDMNLGQMAVGGERTIELQLANHGMRLIYGSITSEVPWLTIGKGTGRPTRILEFIDDLRVPVQVRGINLRARTKAQEGRIVLETNAGKAVVSIRVEVPPIPFAEGVLAGSLSPRQLAEKAKANAAGAAPHFESGAVARWFVANGLQYPVQGPTAPGMAGVQQFFEALGLAKPPKIDFAPPPIQFSGDPGQTFETTLEVSTPDKKLVYAYLSSEEPWIEGTPKPAGRMCAIHVRGTLPPRPGETLTPKVVVHANGNQKFPVPITLVVKGTKTWESAFEPIEESTFEVVSKGIETHIMPVPAELVTFQPADEPMMPSPLSAEEAAEFTAVTGPDEAPPPRRRSRLWLHSIPAVLLVLLLGGFVVRDFLSAGGAGPIDARDRVLLLFDYSAKSGKDSSNTFMFGLQDVTDLNDPKKLKRLTFDTNGDSNSALFKIDGKKRAIGDFTEGRLDGPVINVERNGKRANWHFSQEGIDVQQDVRLVAGDPIEMSPGQIRRLYDTCLIRYKVTNMDNKKHDVGFRFLLDTFIGDNDGTPFTVPGSPNLVQSHQEYRDDKVPDFIQALEKFKLEDPGTIAHLNVKIGDPYEPPSRVSLTRYPGRDKRMTYDVPLHEFNGDSAVVLYWKSEPLAPGKSREIGFTYGAGNVAGNAELTILNPGPIIAGGAFSLVALRSGAGKGESVTIKLPEGLQLVDEKTATQPLAIVGDGKQPSPATWRIRATKTGPFQISVSSGRFTATRFVTVNKTNIF